MQLDPFIFPVPVTIYRTQVANQSNVMVEAVVLVDPDFKRNKFNIGKGQLTVTRAVPMSVEIAHRTRIYSVVRE